jgi:hypothetical protein
MATNALVPIEQMVTQFMLRFKKSNEDYVVYLEHACALLRQYRTYDSREVVTDKISVDSLGIIEMPGDMISFKDLCVAKDGEWWSFTLRPDIVNTTTFTGLIEGQDSVFGEGVGVRDNLTSTLGARGAVNEYYYTIDWENRRIFCDGIKSDTALLKYVSSGVKTSGTTYMPDILSELLDNYLLFKESYWIPGLAREREMRKTDFEKERLRIRNLLNSLTSSQWNDLMWGLFSQNPKRG